MLVLSRHVNESIVIAGNIEVMVVEIRGDKCRLGIECPKHIRVDRLEIHELRLRELREAREHAGRKLNPPKESDETL